MLHFKHYSNPHKLVVIFRRVVTRKILYFKPYNNPHKSEGFFSKKSYKGKRQNNPWLTEEEAVL